MEGLNKRGKKGKAFMNTGNRVVISGGGEAVGVEEDIGGINGDGKK